MTIVFVISWIMHAKCSLVVKMTILQVILAYVHCAIFMSVIHSVFLLLV